MSNRNRCASAIALDSCVCQNRTEALTTPLARNNRPGLPALSYRIGTHSNFLETMKARLSVADTSRAMTEEAKAQAKKLAEKLSGLTARDSSDPSIALLDAWAMVADVLTFYQERIANEGYIRTATEERSIQELARLMGAGQRSGVAATVPLAYTIDPNTKGEVVIPAGSRVQSVPGQNEKPQTFETSEDLKAYTELNVLKPRMSKAQKTILQEEPIKGKKEHVVYLRGVHTNLKSDDRILIEFNQGNAEGNKPQPEVYLVTTVMSDAKFDRTRVVLKCENNAICQKEIGRIFVFRTKTAPFGHNAPLRPVIMLDDKVMRYIEWSIGYPIVDAGAPVAKFEIIKVLPISSTETVNIILKNLSEGYFHTVTWLKKEANATQWDTIEVFKDRKKDGFFTYTAINIKKDCTVSIMIQGEYGTDSDEIGQQIPLIPVAKFTVSSEESAGKFSLNIIGEQSFNGKEIVELKISKKGSEDIIFRKKDVTNDIYHNEIFEKVREMKFDIGEYQISFSIENASGLSINTKTIILQHIEKPKVNFESKLFDVLHDKEKVIVDFRNTTTGEFIGNTRWEFPNGSPSSSEEEKEKVEFNISEIYQARLTISQKGVDHSEPTSGYRDIPLAFFTYSNPVENEEKIFYSFINKSTGKISAYKWYFGNGESSSDENPTDISYERGGQDKLYIVTLIVIRDDGTEEKYSSEITIPAKQI